MHGIFTPMPFADTSSHVSLSPQADAATLLTFDYSHNMEHGAPAIHHGIRARWGFPISASLGHGLQ